MAHAWRFFVDGDTRWRWERISTTQATIQSPQAYATYEECVSAAGECGYKFQPAQEKKRLNAPPVRLDSSSLSLPRR